MKKTKKVLKLILLIIALLLIQGKVSAAVDSAGIYVKKSNNHTSGKYIITREGDDEIPTGETSITLTKSTNEWTNGDVTVTAAMTIPAEEQAKYYIEMSTDGTTWTKTNTVTLNANGRVYARLSNGIYNGNSKYIDVTNIDKENPTTTAPELTATTNSITATYKQTDGISGIKVKKYRITNAEGTTGEWVESTEGTYTFTGLTPGTQYYIQTYGEDYAGNSTISAVGTITTGTIPAGEGNITLTPDKTEWTNGNVIVTASTSLTGYTIQTSIDGTTWTTTNPVTVETNNTTVYARLYDGTNYGLSTQLTISNIDKSNPTNTAPEATGNTSSVTVVYKQTDNGGGIKLKKYRLTDENGTTGEWVESTDGTYTFTGLASNTTYYVQTYAQDEAGNESISEVVTVVTVEIPAGEGNITLTPSTTEWTKDDVTVTATTTLTGYTIQTSTDGTTWTTANPVTVETNNTTVYARLYDGTNYGASTTYKVTKIDKTPPTDSAPSNLTNTNRTSTLRVYRSQYDGGSGIVETKFRITDENGTTGTWVESTEERYHNFTNLEPDTEYYIQTKAVDAVGNEQLSKVAKMKTDAMPNTNVITFTPSPYISTSSSYITGPVTVTVSSYTTSDYYGMTIETSLDGTTWGTTNPIVMTRNGTIYARLKDTANHYTAAATYEITKIDTDGPTYSNIEIENLSETGFEVYVTDVADEGVGLKVSSPLSIDVWTSTSGNDDLETATMTKKDDKYYYKVLTKNHNNEAGTYNIKITMLDRLGNETVATMMVSVSGIARVGSMSYTTLKKAFDVVPDDGTSTTVTLLKDVTMVYNDDKPVSSTNSNMILNLGGYTLTPYTIELNGTTTIRNGTLAKNSSGSSTITNNGTLTTDSTLSFLCTITNNGNATINRSTVDGRISNFGTMTITNGKSTNSNQANIDNKENGTMSITGGTYNNIYLFDSGGNLFDVKNATLTSAQMYTSTTCTGDFNISNCTISLVPDSTHFHGNSNTINITDSNITCATNAGTHFTFISVNSGSNLIINGTTTITGNDYSGSVLIENMNGNLTINSGTITATKNVAIRTTDSGITRINGGTIENNSSSYGTVYSGLGTYESPGSDTCITYITGGTVRNNYTNGLAIQKISGTVVVGSGATIVGRSEA